MFNEKFPEYKCMVSFLSFHKKLAESKKNYTQMTDP